MSFWPYPQREISVLTELNLGHLRCAFEGVPPQPNFLSSPIPWVKVSIILNRAVVSHGRLLSHLAESPPELYKTRPK